MLRESWWLTVLLILALYYICSDGAKAENSCKRLLPHKAPRGMMCLQCLEKRAPGGVTPFISLLKESCLQKPALGFVTDGSFGYDESRLIEAVQGLSEGGRKGAIHIYIYNGPAQRRWRTKTFKSFAVMDPMAFRHKLLGNKGLQDTLKKNVEKLSTVLLYAKEMGVSVSIAPGLEDNLGDESFAVAAKIIQSAVPQGVKVRWVRSTCFRCTLGNDTFVPKGFSLETHTSALDFSQKNGVVSNDGSHVRFSFEDDHAPDGIVLPRVSELKASMQKADKLKNTYLLWIPKYQDSPYGVVPYAPTVRNYQKPSKREKEEIIELLREK